MWKDFRNFALVFLTVFAVLSFSIYTRNKMDRNSIFYDNLVAIKEKIVQDEILEIRQNKEADKKELEMLEAQKQNALLKQAQKNIYVPPVEIVVPTPIPVVVPVPKPQPVPVQVVPPKPSRQTRAS